MGLDLKSVLDELSALRRIDRSKNQSSHIRQLLARSWPEAEARVLRLELIAEYYLHGQHADALHCLLAQAKEEPAEPYYLISLAEHFHYYDVDLERSLSYIAEAIVKARADGKFLYQSLGVQARLAIEAERWPLLEETLRELAEYKHTPGNADVFPETDFLARIPPGAVSEASISAYEHRVEYLRSIGYSTLRGRGARSE